MIADEDIQDRPTRGRPSRQEAEAPVRRRRSGILDVMQHSRLNFFGPGMLDQENYVYRWINDEQGRLSYLTRNDDYDFVSAEDLGPDYDPSQTDSENGERVRMIVGETKSGPLYAYLCRKPRSFWDADNDERSEFHEARLEGRVYHGETTEDQEDRPGGSDKYYVPKGNHLSRGPRRRGPVPRNLK